MEPCSVCGRKACVCDVPTGGVDESVGYYGQPDNGMTKGDWLDVMSDPDYPDDDQEP